MSLKDQKNLFCDKVSVVASGDIGDVIKLPVPININKNSVMRIKGIYTEDVAGGTGAGHKIELMGAGSDVSYDTILASKVYADGDEPSAGDDFNLIVQEADDIQYMKIVATNTTGDYGTGALTAFITHD